MKSHPYSPFRPLNKYDQRCTQHTLKAIEARGTWEGINAISQSRHWLWVYDGILDVFSWKVHSSQLDDPSKGSLHRPFPSDGRQCKAGFNSLVHRTCVRTELVMKYRIRQRAAIHHLLLILALCFSTPTLPMSSCLSPSCLNACNRKQCIYAV